MSVVFATHLLFTVNKLSLNLSTANQLFRKCPPNVDVNVYVYLIKNNTTTIFFSEFILTSIFNNVRLGTGSEPMSDFGH